MLILGIETSCDETAASIVKNGIEILSNEVSSSLKYHKRFGGVIPEIATRHHVENIDKVVKGSLENADLNASDIDAIAVTQGPGLIGALLVGISFAKSLAYALDVPIIAVDHLKAHIYSALMRPQAPDFPFIGLVISGGHTRLCLVKDYDDFKILGDTLDDAIGEAYDKVAKILGLAYPGGPIIDRLARFGDANSIKFTCAPVGKGFDFSFSGIKTAVLYYVKERQGKITGKIKQDIVASFQDTALRVIVDNSLKAMERYGIKTLVIGGGVSANSRFREMLAREGVFRNLKIYFPAIHLCSDNAAMVAGLGYRLYKQGLCASLNMAANSHLHRSKTEKM